MRRIVALLLAAVICVSLCGCKSAAVKEAEGLIGAIGTVTAGSGPAIEAAETAYNALSEKDRQALEGAETLRSAREAFNALLVQDAIAALGSDTTVDEAAVTAAENAFEALTDAEKGLVTNTELLAQARRTLRKQSLMGVWYMETAHHDEKGSISDLHITNSNHDRSVRETTQYIHPEYGGNTLNASCFYLGEEGFFDADSVVLSRHIGDWDLSEDMTQLIITPAVEGLAEDQLVFRLYEEDGFTKLRSSGYPYADAFAFVREEDLDAAFEAKYVFDNKPEDVHQYLGDPISLGYLYDENGERITAYYEDGKKLFDIADVIFFPSQVYDDGLTLLAFNRIYYTFSVGTIPGRGDTDNVVTVQSLQSSNHKLTGFNYLCYVKSDHVAKNYVDESGCRTLELTDGTVIRYANPEYIDVANYTWKYLQADYNDYIY